jgi:acetyltransferase
MDRTVYSAAEMQRLVAPRTIAVVGASEQPGAFGERTLTNLARFDGKVFGVNPKYQNVLGHPCVPRITDLPESPDCVVLCVARPLVETALKDAIAARAGGVIVFASGYAETGLAERKAAQEQLAAMAATGGVRLVGPNCVGMAHVASGGAANFMAGCGDMIAGRAGSLAIVSQSGALGYTLLQAMHRGIGISHFLTAGNSADVDICDYISCLSESAEVRAIVCLFEGVKSGRRFCEAAGRAAKAGKALIVYKAGNSEASSKAAFSHTGTLVGTKAAYQAAFAESGAVSVDTLEGAIELANIFVKTKPPKRGRGVGIMATSGGAGVINADKAEAAGLPLPDLASPTRQVLMGVVPDFGSVANPCDTTAEVLKSSTTFETCLKAFADDPGFSAVVVPLVFAHAASSGARAPTLSAVAARSDCVIAAVWMNEWLEGPGSAQLDADARVVLFRSSERCFVALRLWHDWHDRRARTSQKTPSHRTSPPSAAAAARALIATHRRRTPGALSEQASKEVLAAYGITAPHERLAPTPEAAARAAEHIGFPIVAKIASPDIPHKTEIGGVRLNLTSAAAVGEAAAEILAAARNHRPEAAIDGVAIQQMVPKGIELVLGVRVDPQFGPLIVVGFGGIMVELLDDVATRLAPVGRAEAHEMLRVLRGYRLLSGYRGQAPAAIDAAANAICRLSELAADLSETIAEIDVNPLIVTDDAAIAADALVVPVHEGGRHD